MSAVDRLYSSAELEKLYLKLKKEYGERDSDIYVSTFSRSGTTWMQIILYQLTTRGDMDFEHLFDVSPWILYSAIRNTIPKQVPEPRILKTHEAIDFFPPATKGKFVYVVRDGKDVLVSLFHHKRNSRGYDGSFDEHVKEFVDSSVRYNWFDHTKQWLENNNQLPILIVRYEELILNFESSLQKIAAFCGITLTDEIVQRTIERASFAFMRQHQDKLGPHTSHFSGAAGTAAYVVRRPDQFVRSGQIGEGLQTLTQAQLQLYQQRFDEVFQDKRMYSWLSSGGDLS